MMKLGQRQAFNEIYERYWLKMYLAAFRRVKSEDDAKDIVQDVFCSLWIKRENLVITTALAPYLMTAVKYRVINFIESNLVRGNYLNSLEKALVDYDNSTNEMIISRDLEAFVDLQISHLSPKVREAYQLSRKENLSITEIAKRLHVSDQTVKNHISKALKKLRVGLTDVSFTLSLFIAFLLYMQSR